MGVLRRGGIVAGLLALLAAAPAAAVPDCTTMPKQQVLLSGQGRLESIVGDSKGRLFYTDLSSGNLRRLDRRGAEPKVLIEDMNGPGGLVFDHDGSLIGGFNGDQNGVPGNGMAGMWRIDPETGAHSVFAIGLDQANGIARGPDGSFYASNDIGGGIGRVLPDGTVQTPWADVDTPNGLVIDRRARYLYAAQTFTPAKIARIELADPSHVSTFFSAPPEDIAAGLDGMTRDGADRLYVAANGGGQVWRVDPDGRTCALARGLGFPSAVAFGTPGAGFDPHNLYVTTFTGSLIELVGVTTRPPR